MTVVVPVFNNAIGLQRTLDALANQASEHPAVEVIVVDDGSTDDTPCVAADLLTGFDRQQLIATSNRGPSAARNMGFDAATGAYVVFLDSNDVPLPGWLRRFAEQISRQPGIVHCDPAIADPNVRCDDGFLLPGCFAIASHVYRAVGGYDENLRFAENSDLVERVHAYCARNELEVLHTHEALLAVRDISDPRRYDALRVDAMVHLLNRDAQTLVHDRERMERLASIGAVSAVRSGQPARARALAWTAVKARPGHGRNWVRLVMTAIPVARRRRWPGRQSVKTVTCADH